MRTLAIPALLTLLLIVPGASSAGGATVAGRVRTSAGKPVEASHVLVMVKSWPGGRFSMTPHHVRTDRKGAYSVPILADASVKHEVNIAIVAEGYALESRYESNPGSFTFSPKLVPGHPVTVRFLDRDGKPARGVTAWVAGRKTADGKEHTVFPQGTDPIRRRSDGKGEIRFTQFAKGDRARIFEIRGAGGWVSREFTVRGRKKEVVELRPKGVLPDEDLRAEKDEKKRFFLVGPRPDETKPEKGYGLLLVLAGGDGGAGFRGFARDVYLHAAPEGFLLAHLVSVRWTPDQRIVWPTAHSRVEGAKFTTEEFVDAVVREVAARHAIDRRRVYTLTWSSSGPAAYAVALRKKTPVTGSLIAMSVFHRASYPKLTAAKGRRFYLLHSPTDRVCPIRLAEEARGLLQKAGARVAFKTYEGGHGWPPDSRFDLIGEGLRWLDR